MAYTADLFVHMCVYYGARSLRTVPCQWWQYVEQKADADRKTQKEMEEARKEMEEARKEVEEARKAIERFQKENERAQKEIAALKQRLQDIEPIVTSGGSSAIANLDRFQPKANQSWPISPAQAQASDPLFYDTTYDSEAPTKHMNGSKRRLMVLGAGFFVLWSHLLFQLMHLCIDFIDYNLTWPISAWQTRFQHNQSIYNTND